MSKNKNPHPAGGTAEQGEHGAVWTDDSHNSNFTSGGTSRQGRIFSLLPQGEENAIPGPELARMAGVSPRKLRLMVEAERLKYPICASDSGYFLHDDGHKGILELRKFLRRQDSRCAANRRVTKSARAALKELEHKPLEGQEALF